MIDYSKWKLALAMTESENNDAAWGDRNSRGRQACGRWQQHPSFVQEWAKGVWAVDWSWDDVFEDALHNFFTKLSPLANLIQVPSPHGPATTLAMWFHLHGNVGAGWDTAYAERFAKYYNA